MADFALGLAKTAVDGTLTRALSAIDEESKLKAAAKQDLVYITGEFQMMQAFLKVANKERANNNEVVKTWVRQLRDLAFDVEDCVEFVIHLDNNSASTWMWRMVPSFMAPRRTRDLDTAVDELKQLKARVEDVSQRNTRYNLISDSGPSAPLPAAAQIASAGPSTIDILTELWATNMKKCGFCDLQDIITMTGSDLKVISMWRSAGAEHATAHIISVAYCEQVTTQKFQVHARVKLMHPFHPDEFLKNLLNQLYISTHQENLGVDLRTKESHLIQDELRQLLVNHRYLIILEDLSSSVEWDFIKLFLQDLRNGSRVIISTEQLGAALSCTGEPYLVSELRQFPDGQYLHVFFKKCNISIAEFVRQLGQRRVISLLDEFGDTSSLVRDFYDIIRHKKYKGFMGTKFQEFCWLDVTHPFNIAAFYRQFIPDQDVITYEAISVDEDIKSDEDIIGDEDVTTDEDIRADDDIKSDEDIIGNEDVTTDEDIKIDEDINADEDVSIDEDIKSDEDINIDEDIKIDEDITTNEDISIDEDTRSDEDMLPDISSNHHNMPWLVIINGLQSREEWDSIKDTLVPDGTESCIVILSDKADLVTYCAQDDSPRAIKQEWKEANAAISPFAKADIPIAEILRQLEVCSVVAFWGVEDEVSSLVRDVYQILKDHELYSGCVKSRIRFEKFFWIDVPRPFNGPAFMKRLFDDAFKKARNIHDELREDAWLIVINGLQSREAWKSIKDSLVPEGTKSCIVIISSKKHVATYCQNGSPRGIHEEQKKAYAAIRPFSKGGYFYVYTPRNGTRKPGFRVYQPEDSHIFFSRRLQDASRVPFVASQNRVRADIFNYAIYNGTGVETVWGSTGVGKSAIVRCSYYAEIGFSLGMTESDDIPMRFGLNKVFFQEDRVKVCQFERFGWVDVPCPFDLEEFSRRLFLDFHSLDPEEMEAAAVGLIQGHDPIQGCYEILRKGNYLLVIDGLQSTHDWDIIRETFLLNHRTVQRDGDGGSSVVVIATEERVAKHCVDMDKYRMINVRALEDNGALDLFQKIANDDNKKLTGSKLEHMQHILPKCGGLPKLIAAVGQASSSFWENMNDELVVKFQTDPQFNHLRGLLSWMHSYFDACPDSVKPCIFYLSVFPTNCKIRRGRLLRRWISEGYCRDTVGTTAMENARRVFADLVDLGILEEPTESDMCQINGFFREYIISQPMEDNLVFVLEGHCKLNSQRTGKHLTIMKNWDSDETLYGSIDVSRLRSLTVFCKWESFFISSSMLWIRVLDLEATSDVHDGHLELIFRKLLSLKFISLRGCIELRHLPCSLGGLKQLETLDISGTSIVALPAAIIKLQKIQCIRAGTTDEGWSPAAMEDDDGTVTRKPTPPQGSDGIATIQPQAAASPTEGSDGMARGPPQASTTQLEGSYGMGSGPPKEGATSPEGSDGMATNPPQAAAAAAATSPEGSDGMATSPPQAVAATLLPKVDSAISRLSCSMWKKSQHVRPPHNGGIEVPVGLEEISSLQTLGVVNANSARGKDFLTGLRKFTQLLKLRVCGINRENWEQFCIGLSSHSHLECLSVRFDMDCMDNSFKPPKTLKILKLYGPISKLSDHIKDLVNLKKIDLEMTISKTEDISLFIESLRNSLIVRRICIKPTPEIGKLDLSIFNYRVFPQVLKLDCSSQLEVIFGIHYIRYVSVLIVHCSSESDLQLTGLKKVLDLKMVFLEGFYSNKLKEDLQQEVLNHANKPALKLVKRPSS